MANKRMFSKSITRSSRFMRMPATSRLLYYDLGMEADDDGYCEWYLILQTNGATEQDLEVLVANKFVKVFNENVLIIKDWAENNYIRADRYTESKYKLVYQLSTKRLPVVKKLSTQVRLELGKSKERKEEGGNTPLPENNISDFAKEKIEDLAKRRRVSFKIAESTLEQVLDYNAQYPPPSYRFKKDPLRAANSWLIRDIREGKIEQIKTIEEVVAEQGGITL